MKNYNFKISEFNPDSIEQYLNKNGEPGKSTGFDCVDEYYTIKDAGCTDWTGFPGSGKTFFALELLINQSEMYGKRHILYVPDIGNYNEIIAKLFKMYTGKNFNGKFGNKITMQDLFRHIDWIKHHFLIVERKDFKKPVSPLDFWEFVCSYQDEAGEVHSALIDSWKNFPHDTGGKREDQYLDYTLSYRNELAENNNKHFHTIAHATKTEMEDRAGADGKRRRRIPDANDIKGGGSWYANGKNIITVDFPDKRSNKVDLYISKTKPEGVGKVGAIIDKLFLDLNRGRYYEKINGQSRYAGKRSQTHKPLQPSNEFISNDTTLPF